MMYAILRGHDVVEVPDLLTWGRWYKNADRHVAKDDVDGVHVSTVFLGLDHSFGFGSPLWFETMIFGGEHNHFQERYSTWNNAAERHAEIVAALREGQAP